MKEGQDELHETVRYLKWSATEMFGSYWLLSEALKSYRSQLDENQLKRIEFLKLTNPDIATVEYLDRLDMLMGEGPPGHPDTKILYQVNESELKRSFDPEGAMFRFIGNMVVVQIYQYWEEVFRPRIAEILDKEITDITVSVMGDLRHIRTSIIHNNGVAINDIKKCELLDWFAPGDIILIDYDKVKRIRELIHEFCDDILTS